MMRKKSQAAIEYIMSFGWALLVILVAVGAIAYFGAFDSLAQFTGGKCNVYESFSCRDFKLDGTNQKVVLAVRNVMGLDISDVTAKINTKDCEILATGAMHSQNDINVTGSNNIINGGTLYGTTFLNSGSGNTYSAPPQQYTGNFPQPFKIEDYGPGGLAAIEAQIENKYHYIIGEFKPKDGAVLDGLYYVTGNVKLAGDGISGTYTIVSEDIIEITGDYQTGNSYIDDIMFFSNASGNEIVRLSGDESSFEGYFYSPNGQIRLSGSDNIIVGGLLGSHIRLTGSNLEITYTELDSSHLKLSGAIPNPWINGQMIFLNFTCLGNLQRSFKGNIEIEWEASDKARHTTAGIVEGKLEYS